MTAPLYALTDTWNNGASVFTAILMNVTDTASDAASLLMDLQVAGSSKFRVDKSGNFAVNADTFFYRDAANIFAQRNSTTAQVLRIYNTFTDASNYERGFISWAANTNILTIGMEAAGTGSFRPLYFYNNAGKVTFNNAFGTMGNDANFAARSDWGIGFINTSDFSAGSAVDVSLQRQAALVCAFSSGGFQAGPVGWYQWAGQKRVSSDVNSNNTTTLAIATGLSVALVAGRTYSFEVQLSFTCTAAQGIRAAMVGTGGLTATNIQYDGYIVDSAANGIKGNAQASSLGTVVANAALTGTAGSVQIKGTITVNVAGNLEVQFAQSVAAANNTTVKRGSTLVVFDMP